MKSAILITLTVTATLFARTPEQKSGTMAIMQALREGRSLSSMTIRPTMSEYFDTPEGNFRIHYDLSGSNAVDSVGYVHKIGQYLEESWAFYMDTLGYLPPPIEDILDGGDRYQIYLRNISAYGQTWPGTDGPQPWIDWTSYIEIENDFDDLYPNDDPEGPLAGAMKITCAHEFHHAVQFGLRGTNGAWIAELSSVYYEERIYPQVNDYVWLVDYLTTNPQQPLDWESGYHMYGLGIFAQYMSAVAGDEFLVSVWDTMRFVHEWTALQTMSDRYYHGLAPLFADFSARALLIGSRDGGFFPDGGLLSDMRVETIHRSYPANGTATNRPYGYGMNYVIFDDFPLEDRDLSISFSGAPTADWFVRAIWKSADSVQIIDAIDGDTSGVIVVPFANRAEFVGMSIVPIGNTSTRYNYSYTADIIPSSVAERPLPRKNDLIKAFPNPFNSACVIEINDPTVESMIIYDKLGRKVKSLNMDMGRSIWNGTDDCGENLESGVYFILAGERNQLLPIVFIK